MKYILIETMSKGKERYKFSSYLLNTLTEFSYKYEIQLDEVIDKDFKNNKNVKYMTIELTTLTDLENFRNYINEDIIFIKDNRYIYDIIEIYNDERES